MLNFISFGSGSSGNCYYLYTESEGLLIDTGVGIRTLKKHFHDYGLKFPGVLNAILVTHDHADHIKSVGSLCKKLDIPVFATRLVHSGMDKNYCMRIKIAQKNRMNIEYGQIFNIGSFTVQPFHVPHDSTDNVGYTIKYGGTTFSLLTDVGHVTDEMKDIINQSNYIVIEANYDVQMLASGPYSQYLKTRISCGTGHLSNLQCAQALAENLSSSARHVWLCHLSEENNKPEIARETIVNTLTNAGIAVGKDIEVDVLRRKLPTGIFNIA